MKLLFNLFCRDMEAQVAFYAAVLGLPEAVHVRSPIYRALDAEHFQFGFHAPAARELLNLTARAPDPGADAITTGYPTLMLNGPSDVQAAAARAVQHGGQVLKAPFATYYAQWQAVLSDPEGHVFRVATTELPAGVIAPTLAL